MSYPQRAYTPCALPVSGTIVPPSGPVDSPILLCGEAPGQEEAEHLRPFVGRAGAEQEWYLQPSNISTYDWRKLNVIPEYTEGNPDPTPDQVKRWTPYLLAEVERCKPKLLVAVGRFAMRAFLGQSATLDACHGILHYPGEFDKTPFDDALNGCLIIPTHHPALGFYQDKARGIIQWDYLEVANYAKMVQAGQLLPLPPTDQFKGHEVYRDVSGLTLSRLIAKDCKWLKVITLDCEGEPGDVISIQVCWEPGTAYCLRSDTPDYLVGVQTLIDLVSGGVTFGTHCAGTPNGCMIDISMSREMGLELSRANIIDTMYILHLLKTEYKGLKPASHRHARLRLKDYMSLVCGAGVPRQIAYLEKVLKGSWTHPGPQLKHNSDGTFKLYRPQTISQGAKRILTDILSGKIKTTYQPYDESDDISNLSDDDDSDTDDSPETEPVDELRKNLDPVRKRWENLPLIIRREVEYNLGRFPRPSLNDIDRDEATFYSCGDPDGTLRILAPLQKRIDELGLSAANSRGQRLLPYWEKIQSSGLPARRDLLTQLSTDMSSACESFRYQLSNKYFDSKPINPKSPPAVRELIKKLGLKPRGKRTKSGEISTAKKSIEYLRYHNEAIDLVFKFREHYHIKHSFSEVFLKEFLPDESIHFVHTVLNPAHTESLRPSARKPNLLNVPTKTEIGKRVRKCFVCPPGFVFVSVDFSGIELRVMAHRSGCPNLSQVFLEGRDPHKDYACFLLGRDEVTEKERYFGKTMNFSVGYGMSPETMWENLMKEGQMQWTKEDCINAHAMWGKRYFGVPKYKAQICDQGRKDGYVTSLGGVRRYLPNLRSRDRKLRAEAERHALSHDIQTTAQEMIQESMDHLYPIFLSFEDAGLPIRSALQVYDELLTICPIEYAPYVGKIVQDAFQNHCGVKLDVPVKTDCNISESWGEV